MRGSNKRTSKVSTQKQVGVIRGHLHYVEEPILRKVSFRVTYYFCTGL